MAALSVELSSTSDGGKPEPMPAQDAEKAEGASDAGGPGIEGPGSPEGIESTHAEPPYTVFSRTRRILIVVLCAMAGFFSPFSALTYFPSLDGIAADLGVSLQLMNLTITMYLVVQGIAPAIVGDLADQLGRRPVYLGVLVLYFAACVALALQRSYPALLVLRMVQSAGSSGELCRVLAFFVAVVFWTCIANEQAPLPWP